MKDANAIDVADYLISITDLNPTFSTSIVLDTDKARYADAKKRASDPRRLAYKDLPKVTITLTNATMLEVVQKLTASASLSYEITNNTVIIKGPDGRDMRRGKWARQDNGAYR